MKTRTYIWILRHTSLHLYLKNTCFKSESMCNIDWDIHVKKMHMEKHIFVFPDYYPSDFSTHFYMIYIIR